MKRLSLYFLFIFITISCSNNETDTSCSDEFQIINDLCYYQKDLDILNEFISNGQLTMNVQDFDTSGNNIIEPLELAVNHLNGMKWNELGRLTKLWLTHDNLSGSIPENIGDLEYLDTLNLSFNELEGNIPQSINNLVNLKWFYLRYNNLSGSIPDEICDIYPNFINFLIEGNNFCPPYPECIPQEKIGTQITADCIDL